MDPGQEVYPYPKPAFKPPELAAGESDFQMQAAVEHLLFLSMGWAFLIAMFLRGIFFSSQKGEPTPFIS
jgi:hypothetical protein